MKSRFVALFFLFLVSRAAEIELGIVFLVPCTAYCVELIYLTMSVFQKVLRALSGCFVTFAFPALKSSFLISKWEVEAFKAQWIRFFHWHWYYLYSIPAVVIADASANKVTNILNINMGSLLFFLDILSVLCMCVYMCFCLAFSLFLLIWQWL